MNPLPSALHSNLMALSPLILLAGSAVVVMLAAAFYRHPRPVMMLTLAGLVLSFASLFLSQGVGSRQVTALLVLDHYALFFIGLIVAATFVVAVLCYRYFGGDESRHEALYILLLLAALGGGVLVASSHFASFLPGSGTAQHFAVCIDRLSAIHGAASRSGDQIPDPGWFFIRHSFCLAWRWSMRSSGRCSSRKSATMLAAPDRGAGALLDWPGSR